MTRPRMLRHQSIQGLQTTAKPHVSVAKNRNRRLRKYARRVEPPKSRELCRVVPLTCPSEGGRYHVIASLARLGNDISMFGLFLYSILSEEMSRSAFLPTPRCDMSSFTKKTSEKRDFFFFSHRPTRACLLATMTF